MEPQERASDLFVRDCGKLVEEMNSLNKATNEYSGKVGFKDGRFYATGFTKRGEEAQPAAGFFAQARAKTTGAFKQAQEKAYRQMWRASTTGTLHALDNLRVDIAREIKQYEALSHQDLSPEDKSTIEASFKTLMDVVQTTKTEGLKRLKERYEDIPSGKGSQETIRRAREFQTIYAQFTSEEIKQFTAEDLKDDKKQRANRQIIRNGQEYTTNLTEVPHVDPKQLLVITKKIIFDSVYDATFRDQKKTAKSQLEENTFQIQPYLHVPPLVPQGGRNEAAWVSKRTLKTEMGFQSTTNEVYSTAERAEIEKEIKKAKKAGNHERVEELEKMNHLPNIKVQNDSRLGHLTITCGLIDTELKADEFVETVLQELQKRGPDSPPMKVRLCLHQLNSRAAEKKYIEFQHQMSRYIEKQLRDRLDDPEFCKAHALIEPKELEPIVTHENSAFNVASEIIPWEDSENQKMNFEAYAIRLSWGLDELKRKLLPGELDQIEVLQTLFEMGREILATRKENLISLTGSKDKKEAQQELEKAQEDLKGTINELRKVLERIRSSDDLYWNSVLSLLIDITRQAVPTSEEYADRVRVTQVERNFILDVITGSISELNCKSGLDRTGLARGLWDAMATMMKNKMDELLQEGLDIENAKKQALIYLINLVNNQDELSKVHNKYIEDYLDTVDVNYKIKLETPTEPYKGNFRKEYLEYLQKHLAQINKDFKGTILGKAKTNADLFDALKDALHYQDLVGYHLLTVGLPVTQASTGVAGLKYNHKKESKTGYVAGAINQHLVGNPHPLRRIPKFIQQEDGQVIRMIEGESALTDAGYDLFERLSSNRGG